VSSLVCASFIALSGCSEPNIDLAGSLEMYTKMKVVTAKAQRAIDIEKQYFAVNEGIIKKSDIRGFSLIEVSGTEYYVNQTLNLRDTSSLPEGTDTQYLYFNQDEYNGISLGALCFELPKEVFCVEAVKVN
jgi:hypothetical protein